MGKNGDVCGIRINRLKAYGTAGENRLKVKMGCWKEVYRTGGWIFINRGPDRGVRGRVKERSS